MLILSKFMFKRDRFNLIAWLVGLLVLSVAVAGAFNEMFATPEELMGMIITFENPAIIAMVGPIYSYSVAGIYTQSMLVFVGIAVAMLNIFMVTRHTRADEEEGRMEVLRSLPIGRSTILKSLFINVLIVNTVLGLLIGVGVGLVGMDSVSVATGYSDFFGALVYGGILAGIGLVFAAFTALFVQFSENNRTVLGYSFLFLGITYLLRAVGDISVEFLSILSPLGIGFRSEPFVTNELWPIAVLILTALVVGSLAIYLNEKRDLGAGFIAQKPGKSHGGFLLKSPIGLSLKLLKGSLIGWSITLFILGASYGSVFADIETFVNSNDIFRQMFGSMQGSDMVLGFMSFIVVVMAIMAGVPVINFVLKVKAEERKNRIEHLLSRQVSRTKVMVGYLTIAAIATPILLLLLTLGLYSASAAVMDEPVALTSMLSSVMVYTPALWMLIGIAAFLLGLAPKLTSLTWVFLGYTLTVSYFGQLLDLPNWMAYITPFGHIPTYPIDNIYPTTLVLLTLISVAFAAAGIYGYQRRDILG